MSKIHSGAHICQGDKADVPKPIFTTYQPWKQTLLFYTFTAKCPVQWGITGKRVALSYSAATDNFVDVFLQNTSSEKLIFHYPGIDSAFRILTLMRGGGEEK